MSLRYNVDSLAGVVCEAIPSLNHKVVRRVIACTGALKFNNYLEDINVELIEDKNTLRISIAAIDPRWPKVKLHALMQHLHREARGEQ